MKRKTVVLGITMIALLAGLSACSHSQSGNEEQTSSEVTIVEDDLTPTTEPATIVEEKKVQFDEMQLKVLAEELTTQVVDGDCSEVNSYLTEELRDTYTAEVLQQAYQDTVSSLGSFVTIASSETQLKDNVIYVGVIVQYEKKSIQVLYGFTRDIQLNTFRLNYVNTPVATEKIENDKFYELEIKVGATDLKMDGLMTVPKGVEKPPVVILVQGSGQSDMDETIGAANNKPFADLAYGLAEHGIATIRYNKRYYQYTDNIPEDITVWEEILDDVGDAIKIAKGSDLIDTSHIFVAGHSQGGMLAPQIAKDHPELAGIIMLAGSPRHLEDIIYDQAVYMSDMDTESTQTDIDLYLEMMRNNVESVKNLGNEDLSVPILGFTGYYWKSLNDISISKVVTELKLPMLFLQGSEDFQVFVDKDYAEFQELLKDHENASFIEYEGLNHLFMPTTGVKDMSDYDTENHVDEKVIEDIASWIHKNE